MTTFGADGDFHLGIPMEDIVRALTARRLHVERENGMLVIRHSSEVVTQVEVVPPATAGDRSLIGAIVTVRTSLPARYVDYLRLQDPPSFANGLASLGAVTEVNGTYFVGSRVTFHRDDDTWRLHLPMLVSAIVGSASAVLDPWSRGPMEAVSTSSWTDEDMVYVRSHIGNRCVCSLERGKLTAEFGLKRGASSALSGHKDTALWEVFTDHPHPALGPGLRCLLQLPQRIDDDGMLESAIAELNRMEMEPHDLPPHFGAWCKAPQGNHVGYAAFLPNELHAVYGIAGNMSVWAAHRAQLGSAMLALIARSTTETLEARHARKQEDSHGSRG